MAPLAPSTWMRMSQPFFLLTSPACMHQCCIRKLCMMAVPHSLVYKVLWHVIMCSVWGG